MSVHLFTVSLESSTGLPQDDIVNTFYFEGSGADPANVKDMLDDFYNSVPTGETASVMQQFATDALGGDMTITGYDLSDTPPRAPIYEATTSVISPSSTDMLPPEIALCLSYQAQPISGVPQARRRGRVYLGPFNVAVDQNGRPNAAARGIIAAAARDMLQASNTSVSWEWQQYSRTTGTGSPVVGGWVDNAWDSQRRRGWDATSRTLWDGGTP